MPGARRTGSLTLPVLVVSLLLLLALCCGVRAFPIPSSNSADNLAGGESCSLLKHEVTTESPLVFLHLPKVGGTSVRDALSASAQTQNLTMCADLKLPHLIMDGESYQPVRSCDILFGHLFFGIFGSYNAEKHPIYSVVLRDPIERTLSLYHYVLKYNEHYQV